MTEASGLNFPENSCQDTYDCIFEPTGEVSRREGFAPEASYEYQTVSTDLSAVTEYVWKNVSNTEDLTYVVQQVGDMIYFFEASGSASLSSSIKSFSIDLDTYRVSGAPSTNTPCQFTEGNGRLYISNRYLDPIYVDYDAGTDDITVTAITLEIRDFKRLEDSLSVDSRPSTLSNAHKYNLFNQGWSAKAKGTDTNTHDPVLDYWDSSRSDFPSNADVWWLFKDEDNLVDWDNVDTVDRGNTFASNGHYILDAFFQDRETASGISGIETTTSDFERPATIAFFTGRVWYAGISASTYGSKIYYSQIIESDDQLGRCYQNNDPTSEENSDLLASDGGVISIPGIGQVIKLYPVGSSLFVFGTNGVWRIGGSTGEGFSATDYAVSRVSDRPCLSPLSFVEAENALFWWNYDGIYRLSIDQLSGQYQAVSITNETIKDFYTSIPVASLEYAKGAYDPQAKIIQWVYRSTAPTTGTEQFQYDRILNLRLTTEAFYPWTVQSVSGGPEISGVFIVIGDGSTLQEVDIYVGADAVEVSAEQVVVNTQVSSALAPAFKYTAIIESSNTLAYAETNDDTNWVDWYYVDSTGGDYSSYFISGYKVHGQGVKQFQANYLVLFSTVIADSSAYVQYLWDYATSASGYRFSSPEQVYRTVNHASIVPRRVWLRGQGLVLQIKVYSETGKPFKIVGYSLWETGNANP